jgi:hypothetical protein
VESLLEEVESDSSVRHFNSFVAGEIRTDCEVCFDSERLRTKEVGVYQVGKLKYKSCSVGMFFFFILNRQLCLILIPNM